MSALRTSVHGLEWYCVILLDLPLLLPAQDLIRIGLPGQVEDLITHAGDHGRSRIWAAAGYAAHRRVNLDICLHARLPPAFFVGPTSLTCGFRGIAARGVVRWTFYRPPRSPRVKGRAFGYSLN